MKTQKIIFSISALKNSSEEMRKGFIKYTNLLGYEGDSIYNENIFSHLVRRKLFEDFLSENGFCTFYKKYHRLYDGEHLEYYSKDLKKVALFRLKYSI